MRRQNSEAGCPVDGGSGRDSHQGSKNDRLGKDGASVAVGTLDSEQESYC